MVCRRHSRRHSSLPSRAPEDATCPQGVPTVAVGVPSPSPSDGRELRARCADGVYADGCRPPSAHELCRRLSIRRRPTRLARGPWVPTGLCRRPPSAHTYADGIRGYTDGGRPSAHGGSPVVRGESVALNMLFARGRIISCLDLILYLYVTDPFVGGTFHAKLFLCMLLLYCIVVQLEIMMSTPGALEVVEDLRRSYPSLTFGVGTVLNADDAKKAIRAGAQFLMSPGTVMEILCDLEGSEVLYIPGVLTPTDVISARDAGAEVVKVYPVSVMGGERYMSALKKPFPLLPMVPSQGIAIGSIKSYMEAGASAVVLSDAIFDKKLMGNREFIGISALANQAILQASQS